MKEMRRIMAEFWDIYDENRNKTGNLAQRDGYEFKDGEYHIVVTGIIFNSKYEILISKRASWKKYGGLWECNGGSILAGETSLEGILRELKEELGISFTEKDAIFLKEVKRDKKVPDFKDLWIFQKNISINEITFPDGEATEAKWVTIKQFINMYNNKEIVPTIDFGEEEYKLAVEILKKKKLERYYNNTEADTPKKNVKYFVDNMSPTLGKAIDIGCGAGNDSVYLIKNGWSVVSIDKENVGERISKRLDAEEQKRFKFQQQNFNDMKLEKADLIVANYSLPFCNNEKINYVWKNIVNIIITNAYFVGNFFGIKDKNLITAKGEAVLRGITRDKIFKIAKSLGIEVEEKEIKASEISDLDSLFISGTSVAILPISQVDDIKFDVNNEILIKIMKRYNELLENK